MRTLAILALAAVVALCGCAGYRLGPGGARQAGAKSIEILPFTNRSPEPGLADEVTSALRKSIQRDGTYRLATRGGGDLIVSGVLSEFRRREVSLVSSDVRTVGDYQDTLSAKVTVRERVSGRVVLDRTVTGTLLVRVGQDLVSAERQAAPLLAQEVARQITDLVADGEW